MPVISGTIFAQPTTFMTGYFQYIKQIGLSSQREEPYNNRMMKSVARCITMIITLPILFTCSFYYNFGAATGKTILAISCTVSKKNILGHNTHQYLSEVQNHILYIIHDFAYKILCNIFYLPVLLHAIFPKRLENFTESCIQKIKNTPPLFV